MNKELKDKILEKIKGCYWIEYGEDDEAVQALTKLVEAEKREVVEGFLETLWELRYEEIKPLIDEKIEEYLKKYDLEITSYGRFRGKN
jgi:hypothetical protein